MAKTNPGNIRMQCVIWEPDPVSIRPVQDYTVVYNNTTINKLPENLTANINMLSEAPYGMYLKEKYIYRDTFIQINNKTFVPYSTEMIAENGENLFEDYSVPLYPYINHQTFVLQGSLYNNKTIQQDEFMLCTQEALSNGLSKWTYDSYMCPFDHDGHTTSDASFKDDTNNHDLVDLGNGNSIRTNHKDFESIISKSGIGQEKIGKILFRKNHRFMPIQIAASSDPREIENATANSPVTQKSAPIHWLCQKLTPLFRGEDFFVEFRKLAFSNDILSDSTQMIEEYAPIDSKREFVGEIRNAGVVKINADGSVIPESREKNNLNSQPYYIIEMGDSSSNHHYFIILPYNGNPIFLHVGKMLILKQKEGFPPAVEQSTETVSRCLSTYNELSCKELLDRDSNLRITVRNHLGKIIVTFSGYESKPWIISRSDFTKESTIQYTIDLNSTESGIKQPKIEEKAVPMIIQEKTIKIGAGNMKVGFLFGPLHYSESNIMDFPDPISLKGPIIDSDVNIWLGERSQSNPNSGVNPENYNFTSNTSNLASDSKKNEYNSNPLGFLYFQDAENYLEVYDGIMTQQPKHNVYTPWHIKAIGKDTLTVSYIDDLTVGKPALNQLGQQISYIAAVKINPLKPNDKKGEPYYVKWFDSRYILRAGDANVEIPNKENSNWRIWNCITPIGTGFRVWIPQAPIGHQQTPIDVAHHVTNFSHNWSYTDNAKIEHTANIKFAINLQGTPLFLRDGTTERKISDPDSASEVAGTEQKDMTEYIANLSDKMFFVRIYAWWEGGYMDCDKKKCPCRKPFGTEVPHKNVVFTGFAYGGDITTEGNTRYMECKLYDYMKIIQDQYFINSPFFDGMNDYHAIYTICGLAGLAATKVGKDPWPPLENHYNITTQSAQKSGGETWTQIYGPTGESLLCMNYVLPSAYDILQNPFMKFADSSKYDDAINRISTISGKVSYFDRFGVFRYDIRPDTLFLSDAGKKSRAPKCSFRTSPYHIGDSCENLDLLAFNVYTYKRGVDSVVNDILLVTTTPEGEFLVKSELNLPGRYSANTPGWIGYTKRLLQMDGIFGSAKALENISKYYASMVFKPPLTVSWESLGVPHLQAMDIVTFTGLYTDASFPASNVETSNFTGTLPPRTATLIITSISSEIDAERNEWKNRYEGEWLYGDVPITNTKKG